MLSYAFFDQLTTQNWRNLVSDVYRGNAQTDTMLVHSPDGWAHPMKARKQQHHLNEVLRKIWIQNQIENQCFDPAQASLYRENFDWMFSQAKRRVLGSKSSPILTVKEAVCVFKAMDGFKVIKGAGITPFKFLRESSSQSSVCQKTITSTVLRYFWADPQVSTIDMKEALPLKTILLKGFDRLSVEACQIYKSVFKKLLVHLRQDSDINIEIAIIGIKNMLAHLAFFGPLHGQVFTVPTYLNERWEPVNYVVNRIRISPEDYPFSPYYAYGLMPEKTVSQVPALILFSGTAYPSACGSFFTYLADLYPFKSVGMWAFEQGRKSIEKFVKQACRHTGIKVDAIGQSLGACMAIHMATELSELVAHVHAFSPAALLSKDLKRWNEKVQKGDSLPEVHIYRQQNDIVPLFGNAWGKGWYINYVRGCEIKDSLEGHVRIGSAAKKVTICRIKETVRPSLRRSFLGIVHRVVGAVLFLLGILAVFSTKMIVKSIKVLSKPSFAFTCLHRHFKNQSSGNDFYNLSTSRLVGFENNQVVYLGAL